MSWEDAQAFCKKLSQTDGVTYRLPTEAEWEYACRAGTVTRYHFGDEESKLGDYAWWGGIWNGTVKGEQYAHEVKRKSPNAFGLYDMHGNVWEWCQDGYDEDYYQQFASRLAVDPQGPSSGVSYRVARGGSWMLRRLVLPCGVPLRVHAGLPGQLPGLSRGPSSVQRVGRGPQVAERASGGPRVARRSRDPRGRSVPRSVDLQSHKEY